MDVNNNHNNGLNGNNINNNNARFFGIVQGAGQGNFLFMKTYKNLWVGLCNYDNLELAYQRARKGKTQKPYVLEFEKDLKNNLLLLQTELFLHSYRPKPLIDFLIHDPKTRKISKSDFRDRIVHHALCNIIEPIFDRTFIYDSYANRLGKGTLAAVKRFDRFKIQVSRNNTCTCYILKADIKKYFDNVSHKFLLNILGRRISDPKVLWLIKIILANYHTKLGEGNGMPLGNLTSQFFANVYLGELDRFVKHELKAKYYVRYVDDFVILSQDSCQLKRYMVKINTFLSEKLSLVLHPDKTKVISLEKGVDFLGFRIFPHHRLLRKRSIRKMRNKIRDADTDSYDSIYESLEGWAAHAMHANTFRLRKMMYCRLKDTLPLGIADLEIRRQLKAATFNKWVSY